MMYTFFYDWGESERAHVNYYIVKRCRNVYVCIFVAAGSVLFLRTQLFVFRCNTHCLFMKCEWAQEASFSATKEQCKWQSKNLH